MAVWDDNSCEFTFGNFRKKAEFFSTPKSEWTSWMQMSILLYTGMISLRRNWVHKLL